MKRIYMLLGGALLILLLSSCAFGSPGNARVQPPAATQVTPDPREEPVTAGNCNGYPVGNQCYPDYESALAAANQPGPYTWPFILVLSTLIGTLAGAGMYAWKKDGVAAVIVGIVAFGLTLLILWLAFASRPAVQPLPAPQPAAATGETAAEATAAPAAVVPEVNVDLTIIVSGTDTVSRTQVTAHPAVPPAAPAPTAAAPAGKPTQTAGSCVIHTQEDGRNIDEDLSAVNPRITVTWDPDLNAQVEVIDKNVPPQGRLENILLKADTSTGGEIYFYDNWMNANQKYYLSSLADGAGYVQVDWTGSPGQINFPVVTDDIPGSRAGHTIRIKLLLEDGTQCQLDRWIDP